jgi:hypothetical protein
MELSMILLVLFLVAVPFILPVAAYVAVRRLRGRVEHLEVIVEDQRGSIEALKKRIREQREPVVETKREPIVETKHAPIVEQKPETIARPHIEAPRPVEPPPAVVPPPIVPAVPPAEHAATQSEPVEPRPAPGHHPAPPIPPPPVPPMHRPPVVERPSITSMPPVPPHPPAAEKGFDWESVIGVKLFSAIAGIALVLAAIFFLQYSVAHGWLEPPVRFAIGVFVAIALLVACERSSARQYAVTTNALDAAAVAILYATFFAAHTPAWHLIPASVTFILLALVTVVAVLLSIRHESLFIAVLGMLGGFATPALLSTGENQPIPLFTYLLMLNIGLAWVGSRKKWPVLTILTLILTAIYQWGWVLKFLDASQLSLAMGIFIVFAIVALTALLFGRTDTDMDGPLATTSTTASVMPLMFALHLAWVPEYGAHPGLMFGFLLLIDAGLAAVAIGAPRIDRDSGSNVELPHVVGALATLLVFAIWLTRSYLHPDWPVAVGFTGAFIALYSFAPFVADKLGRPFSDATRRAEYVAPMLLFVLAVIARIEPAVATPWTLFGVLFALLLVIAWRALASEQPGLYFVAAFFALVAEGAWSSMNLTSERLFASIVLYAGFGVFYLGVPLAARRLGRALTPEWGSGALTLASLLLLMFLAQGPLAPAALWGLALLLAILNAGLFVESASGRMPWLSVAGAILSWVVLGVWWSNAAAIVGVLPSLLVVVGLSLVMLVGHTWAHMWVLRQDPRTIARADSGGFQHGIYIGLVGHLFMFYMAQDPCWSLPPWPMFGALAVMTLGACVAAMAVEAGELHAAAVISSALVVLVWTATSLQQTYGRVAVAAAEIVAAYGLVWLGVEKRARMARTAIAVGAAGALFIGEIVLVVVSASPASPGIALMTTAHVVNVSLILAIAWRHEWQFVAPLAVLPAWLATYVWHEQHPAPAAWKQVMTLAASLYAVFTTYPFVLYRRVRDNRDPHLTAVLASAFFFFTARLALLQGGLGSIVGIVPVGEAAIMAVLLRELLSIEAPNQRDLGRLALVAGAALAFVTVAIPLQLNHQWITIGWALEGIALAWLYRRIPHRGLLLFAIALLGTVFARLALNPAIFVYEPRGMRVFNWYLYTYVICGISLLVSGWLLSKTDDELVTGLPRPSALLPAAGVILLFLVLNIEIADYYATGREITFEFGVSIAQDLTYTIGWLIFGLILLGSCIQADIRAGRVAAVILIAVTTCKAFLYDMRKLGGLYRVASLVGLACSLALVALALQKFVLAESKEASS